MESKKSPRADLARYSRPLFLAGLVVSLTGVLMAFRWTSTYLEHPPRQYEPDIASLAALPVIPPTRWPEPPADVPKQPVIINPPPIAFNPVPTSDPHAATEPVPVYTEGLSLAIAPELVDSSQLITTFPEVAAEPIDGYPAFYLFLRKNLKYPARARAHQTSGRVFIEFVVNTDGTGTEWRILKGIGDGCDEEALRVLQQVRWNPGKQRGRPVRVKMVMPVQFQLAQ